jgi:thiol-disulfide isomerase/thioredoxin
MSYSKDKVIFISSDSQFTKLIKEAGSRLVVVDFFATWCLPCKMIAPIFAEYSIKYPSALFLKVDVDQLHQTSEKCGVF